MEEGYAWSLLACRGKGRQEFLDFLIWDAKVANESEPGTLNFDVYADTENADAIYVYEAYRDEAAFGDHRANAPFQKWVPGGLRDELVAEMTIISPFSASLISQG